jgi:hypothetical protein
MKKEEKITYQEKLLQFVLGVFIGIALWGLTLIVLLILN